MFNIIRLEPDTIRLKSLEAVVFRWFLLCLMKKQHTMLIYQFSDTSIADATQLEDGVICLVQYYQN